MQPKPFLQLHTLVLVYAFTAVLGELIQLPAITLVSWRTGIAAFIFFAVIRPKIASTAAPFRKKALLTGVLLGAHWMTFFGAIKLSNITVCLTGVATVSLFTAIIEALQERRKPRANEILLGLIMIPSILLIIGVATAHMAGLICAIVSALLAACFTVINKSLVRNGAPSGALTQYEMLGACVTCVSVGLAFSLPQQAWIPATSDWLWLIILSTVCTVFAFEWHIKLLRYFSAFESNLAINLEPVYGILMAAVLFGEHKQMHPLFFLGASMILATNLINPTVQFFKKRKALKALKMN